jgi:hypothetical protein
LSVIPCGLYRIEDSGSLDDSRIPGKASLFWQQLGKRTAEPFVVGVSGPGSLSVSVVEVSPQESELET